MKNNVKIIRYLITGLFLIAMGCEKLEETPKSSLTSGTFYKTKDDLWASTVAIFNILGGGANWNGFSTVQGYSTFYGGDDVITRNDLVGVQNKGFGRDFDEFRASSSSEGVIFLWQTCFGTIRQSNEVLENYEKVENCPELDRNQCAAIAHFTRAFAYFMLVQTYGGVPIFATNPTSNTFPKRDAVKDVYNFIVEDLQFAENYLPVEWPGEPGKPTVGACKSLLSKVYLTMAGWPLKQSEYYLLAAQKASEVINSGDYDLMPAFADFFKLANNNCKESIFALQYSVALGFGNHVSGMSSQPSDESGWDDFYAELAFYKRFPAGPRKLATFYDTINVSGMRVPYMMGNTKHPYYRKFRDGGIDESDPASLSTYDTDRTMPFIRFADILLVYAEAKSMANGSPTESCYWAINRVRNRAGLQNLTPALNATAFRDSVVQERAWELAGEWQRWFDMVRLEIVEEVSLQRDPEEIPTFPVTKESYLCPIPQSEINLNPNLLLNP